MINTKGHNMIITSRTMERFLLAVLYFCTVPVTAEPNPQLVEKYSKLIGNKTEFVHISLYGLPEFTLTDADAEAIAAILAKNHTLKKLDLGRNKITSEGTKKIAEALKNNSTLTYLDLGDNEIGPEGAEKLAEFIAINSALLSLSLNDNKIGDKGAEWVANLIKKNKSLYMMSMEENQISDTGAKKIIDALSKNSTFTYFILDASKPFDNPIQERVSEITKRNGKIQSLLNKFRHVTPALLTQTGSNFDILPPELKLKILVELAKINEITP